MVSRLMISCSYECATVQSIEHFQGKAKIVLRKLKYTNQSKQLGRIVHAYALSLNWMPIFHSIETMHSRASCAAH